MMKKAVRSNCILGHKLDTKDDKLYFHGNFIGKSELGDNRFISDPISVV